MDTQFHLPEPSDEILIEQVKRQNVTAFTLLFDRYAQTVYVLATHLLHPLDAEEVVQEVFLRLWDRAHQFDPERGSFRSWFMTIARNYVMDELKRRNHEDRVIAVQEVMELLEQIPAPNTNVEEEAWRQQRQHAMLQALGKLPVEQRRVLILAYFGGLSQQDIAKRLDWPLGTVKARARLALQKLRNLLFHWDEVR